MQQSIEIEGFAHNTSIPAASRVGPLLATSVIIGRNDETRDLPDTVEAQLNNLFVFGGRILDAAGATWSDIVKFDFVVADRAHRGAVEEAWLRIYPDPAHMPARHTRTADLPDGMFVQMTFLAWIAGDAADGTADETADAAADPMGEGLSP
ncbi:MAG: RidA family protein [Acidimicrobiia bacterium]|nr:RidA family protein [Acidimicrobiia bacterium]MDH5519549.1 RidA family protein [Acidimicrobiia bacterium]